MLSQVYQISAVNNKYILLSMLPVKITNKLRLKF